MTNIKRYVEYCDSTRLLRICGDEHFVEFEVDGNSVFLPVEQLHELLEEVSRFAPPKAKGMAVRGGEY